MDPLASGTSIPSVPTVGVSAEPAPSARSEGQGQAVVIGVYNVKGGVGKTASTVNLSYCASVSGNETLVWDLDAQGASTFYFRARTGIEGGAADLVRDGASLAPWIRATEYEGLDLVPADGSFRKLDLVLRAGAPIRRLPRG